MRCPSCGGHDGIMMLRFVGPCLKCEREERESRREQSAFLTSKDLGVKEDRSRVRFVPLTRRTEVPSGAKDFAYGFGGPSAALAAARDLNAGNTNKTRWGWAGLGQTKREWNDAVVDMGADPNDWVEVPDGEDWGQKK